MNSADGFVPLSSDQDALSLKSFQFRPALPSDRDVLATIYLACKNEADWLCPVSKMNADFTKDTEDERVFVVHRPDAPPLGFVSVWEPPAFIHHLYIHPTAQGRGLGSFLLESLETIIPRPWQLKCTLANRRAYRFYLARGWQQKETGEGFNGPYALLERA